MANNRMFLVNRRTGTRIYLAKFYPSTGWYVPQDVFERLTLGFDQADFGHLTAEERTAKDAMPGFGPPYSAAEPINIGNEWELKYDHEG